MNIHPSTITTLPHIGEPAKFVTLPHIGEPAKFVTLEHIELLGASYIIAASNWNELSDEVRTELLKVLKED